MHTGGSGATWHPEAVPEAVAEVVPLSWGHGWDPAAGEGTLLGHRAHGGGSLLGQVSARCAVSTEPEGEKKQEVWESSTLQGEPELGREGKGRVTGGSGHPAAALSCCSAGQKAWAAGRC